MSLTVCKYVLVVVVVVFLEGGGGLRSTRGPGSCIFIITFLKFSICRPVVSADKEIMCMLQEVSCLHMDLFSHRNQMKISTECVFRFSVHCSAKCYNRIRSKERVISLAYKTNLVLSLSCHLFFSRCRLPWIQGRDCASVGH